METCLETRDCSAALLIAAAASLERGDLIAAGCQLREAIRRHLIAECVRLRGFPRRRWPTTYRLAKTYRRLRAIDPADYADLVDAIRCTNALAHCEAVEPTKLASALQAVGRLLQEEPAAAV